MDKDTQEVVLAALEFYADFSNWERFEMESNKQPHPVMTTWVQRDRGARARVALNAARNAMRKKPLVPEDLPPIDTTEALKRIEEVRKLLDALNTNPTDRVFQAIREMRERIEKLQKGDTK